MQAGGEDLTALGAAGVLDHVVIYEPLPPAPDYKRSVQFSIYVGTVPKVPVRYQYCALCTGESVYFVSLSQFLNFWCCHVTFLNTANPWYWYVMRCSRICIVEDPGCLSRFPDPNFSTPDPGSRVP